MSRKEAKRRENLAALRKLKTIFGFELREFSWRHFRIIGEREIDYWPTTDRYWFTGSKGQGAKASVEQIVRLAMELELRDDAAAHMKSIFESET